MQGAHADQVGRDLLLAGAVLHVGHPHGQEEGGQAEHQGHDDDPEEDPPGGDGLRVAAVIDLVEGHEVREDRVGPAVRHQPDLATARFRHVCRYCHHYCAVHVQFSFRSYSFSLTLVSQI